MSNGLINSDHNYHAKQKDPVKSMREEIAAIYKSCSNVIEQKTTDMVNQLGDTKELYYKLRDHKQKYTENFSKFSDGITIDRHAVDRDPLLSKFQKTFEAQMLQNAYDSNGSNFLKNNYSGYGASARPWAWQRG